MKQTNIKKELALMLALSTLWGASYSFIKIGVETIPPLSLIAGRTLIAAVLLTAILKVRGVTLPNGAAIWGKFLVQASLNSAIPFTLIAWAEQSTDAGIATILNATTPIFAFLLTALLTRHDPVNRRKLCGVATGIAGASLIVGLQAMAGVGHQLWAELAILAASGCYGGAAIFGRHFRGLDPMIPATGSILCGAALLVPASLAIDRPWTLNPSADSVLALFALSSLSTALAFVIYFRLLQTLGSVGTTAQAYLRVPIGVAISVLFLRESVTPAAGFGLVAVVAGVAAMTIPAPRAPATR
ncbi:MAG: EamA family transporter [Azospirillaceae bacterium]|nr:EamA family transporter [Azospirillaceae bacterium]